MSKADLQIWLLKNSCFKVQYLNLVLKSVAGQFSNLIVDPSITITQYDWNYLLLCASLLAQSDNEICQDAALRIAQHVLEHASTSDSHKDAAAVVLDCMANRPAINLAERRNLIHPNYAHRLPYGLLMDWTKRSIENSIVLSDATTLEVNKFQRLFWNSANHNDWLSVSAPTSAGKSFIVGQWLAEFLKKNDRSTIVYIVPTRALIQQVYDDIENVLKKEEISGVSVTTLPLTSSVKTDLSNVLIFTQERFQILLNAHQPNISCDLLIIDEAQKIGDGSRGVLLQQVIELAVFQNPRCKVLFASPMTENPSIFLEDAPDTVRTSLLASENITVNQNLLWVSQKAGQSQRWNVELVLDSKPVSIGAIHLTSRPSPESKRLPFVAFTLSNPKGGNIIYVNGASSAETTAKQLFDLIQVDSQLLLDKEIIELVDLIKKTIHSKYSLWNVLSKGIAYHYGDMPLLVRTEIERLFAKNKIKYLICTSTLIEGVNMPCQSIFVRGPTKGRGNPMSHSDFWNLAGRAGRWGKEFQGNVICIDVTHKNVWKEDLPTTRTKYKISRTSDGILNKPDELLKFIESKTPRDIAIANPNLEYLFSFLVSSYIRNGSIRETIWARRFSPNLVKTLDLLIANTVNELVTPSEIIHRNPGISPIAMDNLLLYFDVRTTQRNEPIEGLIPVPPESDGSLEAYEKILHRINSHLGKVFGPSPARVRQLALLIVNWMQGYPLAKIISRREDFYNKRKDPYKIANLIRQTMADVERIARFQAPKYLACYVDLLKFYLLKNERSDLLERVMELNILLEFGVSQTTQLSLMGLGLSRSTAVAISEYIADTELNEAKCIGWLRENSWMTEDLPEISKREISYLLDKKSYY